MEFGLVLPNTSIFLRTEIQILCDSCQFLNSSNQLKKKINHFDKPHTYRPPVFVLWNVIYSFIKYLMSAYNVP